MRKIWLVARGEFLNRAGKRSFLVGTFLIPLIFAITIAITVFVIERDKNTDPFGYVDQSGLLKEGRLPAMEDDEKIIEFIAFPDKDSALIALENREIQAFHVIPGDFLRSRKVDLYYWDEYPDSSVLNQFDDFVRANLLPEGPNTVQNRIIEGINLTLQSSDGKRQFDNQVGFIVIIFPLAVAMFFFFAVTGASGYFLQAITDEKENRTMEIAITSMSPWQLISGKSIGLVGVALSQIVIWLVSITIVWMIAQNIFTEIQGIKLPWDILLIFAFFFIPTFTLIAAMMAAIGGAVTELQEGQQISGVLNLLFTFPLFFSALAFADPNSSLLVFFSFFPTTSFLTITIRWGLTIIPVWQIALSWFILIISDVVVVWIATRIFRMGMLNYGQKLSLKTIISTFRLQEYR
jgi:ABC-2 type transport system permease protein